MCRTQRLSAIKLSLLAVQTLLFLTTQCFARAETSYSHYENTRYTYSIDYPDLLVKQHGSEADQVQTFLSADNSIELFIRFSPLKRSWDGKKRTLESEWKDALFSRKKDGDSVTYEAKGPNSFVLSGYSSAFDKASIYYMKVIMSTKGVIEFHLRYPTSRKAEFAPVVSRVAKSFKTTAANAPSTATTSKTTSRVTPVKVAEPAEKQIASPP